MKQQPWKQALPKMHTLIEIGYLGNRKCYLDIPRDEAIKRYESKHGKIELRSKQLQINEFAFKDEFNAFEVWTADGEKLDHH